MSESRLEEIVAEIINSSGCKLLKKPEEEPHAFDFGFQNKRDKRIAVEVKIRGSLTTYAVVVGANVRIAREAGYDEIWLVTPEVPTSFYATKGIDEGEGAYARWLTLAQFAAELDVSPQAVNLTNLTPSTEKDTPANSEGSGPPSGQNTEQRPQRNRDLQRLLLLQVRDGTKPVGLKKFSEAEQIYNSALLINDGLVEGEAIRGGGGGYGSTVMTELTTAGHDFLDRSSPQPPATEPVNGGLGVSSSSVAAADSVDKIAEEIQFLTRQLSQIPLNPVERDAFEGRIAELRQALKLVGVDAKTKDTLYSDAQTENTRMRLWDAEFAKLRRDSGFRWSTTLDRVLDLLWEEHSAAFQSSVADLGRRGKFKPQLTPRALFLAALLYGARHEQDLRDRADDRGQTLIRVYRACGLKEKELHELLVREFFRDAAFDTPGKAIVNQQLERAIQRADEIRKNFGSDPYIGTRHLFLAFLDAPDGGVPGEFVIRPTDGMALSKIIAAFADSVTNKLWVKQYDTKANWPEELDRLRNLLPFADGETTNQETAVPTSIDGTIKTNSKTGTLFSARREAGSDELCLDIKAYSTAIADTFTAAATENDFVFALYAPWGRGKSTLIKETAKILGGDEATKQPGRRYKSIFFSAWKYPTRPEVWVHLHQKIAAVAKQEGLLQKLRISFRVGLLKDGWWPLLGGFTLLALSRLQFEFAHWLFNTLGIIGLLVVGSFVWNASAMGRRFAKTYFSIPDHEEKLGLQAVIGQDLRNLLNVWITPQLSPDEKGDMRSRACDFSNWAARWKMVLLVFLIWASLALIAWKIHRYPTAGGSLVLSDCALGCLALTTGVFAWVITQKPRQYERVFLVVDDLDRCEPNQMLAVIESLRLFLDEPEMSRRLQIAMLLDRAIFKRVITERGKNSHALVGNASDSRAERFFREQEEKLFVVTLQLPQLGATQVSELAVKIVDREYHQQLRKQLDALQHETLTPLTKTGRGTLQTGEGEMELRSGRRVTMPARSYETAGQVPMSGEEFEQLDERAKAAMDKIAEIRKELGETLPSKDSRATDKKMITPDISFEAEEREFLKAFLGQLMPAGLTPRALRAFVVRYQLVRLLLRRLGHEVDPSAVIAGLAAQLYPEANNSKLSLSPVIEAAIKSVAGDSESENEGKSF